MSTPPSSIEAAAREVIDSGEAPEGIMGRHVAPEQLDAFRDDKGNLPPNVFQLVREEEGAAKRGPGRPKNSKNKASKDMAKFIAHKYGDPVEYLASIYAMPLDQLCETMLAADGTVQRREELEELLVALADRVEALAHVGSTTVLDAEDYRNLTKACEALGSAASKMQGKPGDLAIKALNVTLSAAKAVSEYCHSKQATKAKVEFDNLPVFMMPGGKPGVPDFSQQDQETRFAADLLANALKQGRLEPQQLLGLELKEGQLVVEGEYVEVTPDEDGDSDG
jgi:hypothetical protein